MQISFFFAPTKDRNGKKCDRLIFHYIKANGNVPMQNRAKYSVLVIVFFLMCSAFFLAILMYFRRERVVFERHTPWLCHV